MVERTCIISFVQFILLDLIAHDGNGVLHTGGVSRPKLIPIFLGATAVTQQISVVVIFLVRDCY